MLTIDPTAVARLARDRAALVHAIGRGDHAAVPALADLYEECGAPSLAAAVRGTREWAGSFGGGRVELQALRAVVNRTYRADPHAPAHAEARKALAEWMAVEGRARCVAAVMARPGQVWEGQFVAPAFRSKGLKNTVRYNILSEAGR